MEGKLIAGSVKSNPLNETRFGNRTSVWTGPALKPEFIAKVNNQLNYTIRLNSQVIEYKVEKLLRVQVENPEQNRLYVKLEDKNGQTIHWESLTQKACLLKLNISKLKSGVYTLEVTTPNRNYTYVRQLQL